MIECYRFAILFFLWGGCLSLSAQINWQKSPGPKEPNVTYLSHAEGIWYMVGYEAQYSADDGLSWQTIPGSENIFDKQYYSAVVTPYMEEIDLSGSTAYVYFDPSAGPIRLYTNRGTDSSWTRVPFTPRSSGAESLIQYGDTAVAIATEGSQHRLARTTNGGQDWTLISDQFGWGYANSLYRSDGKIYLVQGDMWVSADETQTWSRIYQGNVTLPYTIRNAVFFGDVIVCKTQNNSKLLVSVNGGQNWQVRNAPGTNFVYAPAVCVDGNKIYASFGGEKFYTSQDSAKTWTPLVMTGLPAQGSWSAGRWKIVNGTMLLVDSYKKQLYRSTDGGASFLRVNNPPVMPLDQSFARSGDTWFTCTDQALYRSVDAGKNWVNQNVGAPTFVAASGNYVVAVGYQVITFSMNKGQTWTTNSGTAERVAASNNVMYYTQENKVYRNLNGTGWNQINNLPAAGLGISYFRVLTADGPNVLLAASKSHVFRSPDQGNTWTLISDTTFTGKALTGGGIFFGREYIVADAKLYVRGIDGLWEKFWDLPPIESDPATINLVFGKRADKLLAFFYGAGVYISPDSGATWTPFPDVPGAGRLSQGYTDNELTAVSMSGGLYTTPDLFDAKFSSGLVYLDLNLNQKPDSTDLPMSEMLVSSTKTDQVSSTNNAGRYRFLFTEPDTIQVGGLCKHCSALPPFREVSMAGDTFHFAIQTPPGITDLAINLSNIEPIRAGFETNFSLTVRNVGTDTSGGIVTLNLPAVFEFVSAQPAPFDTALQEITWNQLPLLPGQSQIMNVRLKLDQSQAINTQVSLSGQVNPDDPDVDFSDNTDSLHLLVVGSFDPNDKSVYPEGDVNVANLADSVKLTYTIRFQNTGNYPAEVVKIIDTLPAGLDLRSIALIANSHPVEWQLSTGGVLTFRFDNIFLPDSVHNEPESHGFVKFTVLIRADQIAGLVLQNRASIYFDFNQPVHTNAVQNQLIQTVGIETLPDPAFPFEVLPTLAHNSILLKNRSVESASINIYNSAGIQMAIMKMNPGIDQSVDINLWPTGVYFVTIRYASGEKGQIPWIKVN